jgi:hypothetical protein
MMTTITVSRHHRREGADCIEQQDDQVVEPAGPEAGDHAEDEAD